MVKKKKTETSCDFCNNLVYDDEIESYVCDVNMDEDDYARFFQAEHIVRIIRAMTSTRLYVIRCKRRHETENYYGREKICSAN